MMLSPNQPLCWKDAIIPIKFQNKTSCILVRDQLSKDLDVDMRARNVLLTLQCKEIKQEEKKINT